MLKMTEYRLKTGKVGKKITKTAKKVEDKFVESFLIPDKNSPSGYSLKTGNMGQKATSVYQKIENTVVGGYKKIEDQFVDSFLEKVECDNQEKMTDKDEKENHDSFAK
jgi:hypothetical protein